MVWIRSILNYFVLFLVLPLLASASRAGLSARHSRLNTELSKLQAGALDKLDVFVGARWTWYEVGLGACGKTNVRSDFIVAMNIPQFGEGYPGRHCGKTITMTYNGKTTEAMVMDKCQICPPAGLDLSPALFNFFAPPETGVLFGTWKFTDGSGGGTF